MKKSLKIVIVIICIIIGFILLDTIQARIFKNSPLISWKESLEDDDSFVKRGILIDTYYCRKDKDIETVSWHFKTSKFTCPIDNVTSVSEPDSDIHSFFGKVVESHSSYIIVEPNEEEEERKSSDKFRINLGKNNDMIYEVGTNVKITYKGLINESYPAQIGTIDIEVKSAEEFELIFHQEPGNVKKQIIDKKNNKQYDYNVYIYSGKVDINIDDKTYSLEKALKENKITMDEIIAKANQDIKNPIMYKDGGSIEYHYDNYTIIKFHSLDGNRDVYIGDKNLQLGNIK